MVCSILIRIKMAKLVNEVYRGLNSNQYPLIVADIRLPKGKFRAVCDSLCY